VVVPKLENHSYIVLLGFHPLEEIVRVLQQHIGKLRGLAYDQGLKNWNSAGFQNWQKPVDKLVKPIKNYFTTVISFDFYWKLASFWNRTGPILPKTTKISRFSTIL
jgi:hypothetical protein